MKYVGFFLFFMFSVITPAQAQLSDFLGEVDRYISDVDNTSNKIDSFGQAMEQDDYRKMLQSSQGIARDAESHLPPSTATQQQNMPSASPASELSGNVSGNNASNAERYLPSSTTSQQKKGLPGDVSGDGFISNADALLLKAYLADETKLSRQQLSRADANGDGRIDEADLKKISQEKKDIQFDVVQMDQIVGLEVTTYNEATKKLQVRYTGAGNFPLKVNDTILSQKNFFLLKVTSITKDANGIYTLQTEKGRLVPRG